MLKKFIAFIDEEKWDLDPMQMAEVLWFVQQVGLLDEKEEQEETNDSQYSIANSGERPEKSFNQDDSQNLTTGSDEQAKQNSDKSVSDEYPLTTPSSNPTESSPIKLPDTGLFRNTLELSRFIKLLKQKVNSRIAQELDVDETVRISAELSTFEFPRYFPVLTPKKERWLDIALLIEDSKSMILWQSLLTEVQDFLEHLGAFRDIKPYGMQWDDKSKKIQIYPFYSASFSLSPQQLNSSDNRRLILIVSDCISPAWRDKEFINILQEWATQEKLTLLNPFPERMWERTNLDYSIRLRLGNEKKENPTKQWEAIPVESWQGKYLNQETVKLPILNLERESMAAWVKVMLGKGTSWCAGAGFSELMFLEDEEEEEEPLTPREQINNFYATSSELAWQLIQYLSAIPVNLSTIRLVQRSLLPISTQVNVAEVVMGGLLSPVKPFDSYHSPHEIEFEFKEGIREIFLESLGKEEFCLGVIGRLTEKIASHFGYETIREFEGILLNKPWEFQGDEDIGLIQTFATISVSTLRQYGEKYAGYIEKLDRSRAQLDLMSGVGGESVDIPETFEDYEFEADVATIVFNESVNKPSPKPRSISSPIRLGIWGFTGAGKSVYMLRLFEYLLNEGKMQLTDKDTEEYIDNGIKLLDQGIFVPPTETVGKKSKYFYTIHNQDGSNTELTFFDLPGEILMHPYNTFFNENREKVTVVDYLLQCHGIIFLLSPLQEDKPTLKESYHMLLTRLFNAMQIKSGQKTLEQYIVFGITKIDHPEVHPKCLEEKYKYPEQMFIEILGKGQNVNLQWLSSFFHAKIEAPKDNSRLNINPTPKNRCQLFYTSAFGTYKDSDGQVKSPVILNEEEKQENEYINPNKYKINTAAPLNPINLFSPIEWLVRGIKSDPPNIPSPPISVVKRQKQKFRGYKEYIDGVPLEMVLIPDGTFTMGAPESEEGSYDYERPQHNVTISAFLMGRYPVTQKQWSSIASRTDLKVNLDLNPDPSNFKEPYQGIDRWQRPVDQVSWYEVVEFSERLSKLTGKNYRLPSEAEWEYACRAGTTTPFHFGETISTDLANYQGTGDKGSYGEGPKGEYRQQTTPVGYLKVANSFGLSDMHGNVWEWCADNWHSNYGSTPTNGKAWLNGDDDRSTVRGGSWSNYPSICRSATRIAYNRHDFDIYDVGFRIVCDRGKTL